MKATLKQLEDSKNQMENLFNSTTAVPVAAAAGGTTTNVAAAPPTPLEMAALLMARSKQKYNGKLTLANIGKVVPLPPPTNLEPQVQVTTRDCITFAVPRNATPEVLETRLRTALVAEAIRLRTMSSTTAHFSEDMEIDDLPHSIAYYFFPLSKLWAYPSLLKGFTYNPPHALQQQRGWGWVFF